jgi:hypothetical protein
MRDRNDIPIMCLLKWYGGYLKQFHLPVDFNEFQ